jgi:hypothetical protein
LVAGLFWEDPSQFGSCGTLRGPLTDAFSLNPHQGLHCRYHGLVYRGGNKLRGVGGQLKVAKQGPPGSHLHPSLPVYILKKETFLQSVYPDEDENGQPAEAAEAPIQEAPWLRACTS